MLTFSDHAAPKFMVANGKRTAASSSSARTTRGSATRPAFRSRMASSHAKHWQKADRVDGLKLW
eukprot:6333889-Lingulodinium_polyedra.AAC.1